MTTTSSRPSPPFGYGLYPALSVLGLIFLIVPLALLAPSIAGSAILMMASISGISVAYVLSVTPPLAPVSTLSALHSRLAWLGKFIIGGFVLVGGIMIARLLDSLTPQEALFAAPSIAAAFMPAGAGLFVCILLVDITRIPAPVRASMVRNHLQEHGGWAPPRVVATTAQVIAGMSHPGVLIVWGGLAIFVFSVLLA